VLLTFSIAENLFLGLSKLLHCNDFLFLSTTEMLNSCDMCMIVSGFLDNIRYHLGYFVLLKYIRNNDEHMGYILSAKYIPRYSSGADEIRTALLFLYFHIIMVLLSGQRHYSKHQHFR
jgi:hypothetical protein